MNFYVILGVPQDASTADIKRAYRRLARRYHPGVNPGDRAAEEMFRADRRGLRNPRRSESAPAVRQRRERIGARGRRRRRSCSRSSTFPPRSADRRRRRSRSCSPTSCIRCRAARSARAEVGADLHTALTVSFADAVHGVERQVLVTRQVLCGACAGAGQIAIAEAQCRQCQGTGHIRWARGHMVFSKPCGACGGEGRQRRERCAVCAGQGRGVRGEAVSVQVPPGITDGGRLRVVEMGHAGRHGGPPGDLYVTVHVQPHPWFRREGDDLVCGLPVAVHEAALGARIDVPSLDGPVKLRVPPGSAVGTSPAGRRRRYRHRDG